METETRINVIDQIKGRTVDMHRNWNNSMYIYSDSATIWNSETMETETIHCGIDFWDGVSFDSVKASDCVINLYNAIKDGKVQMLQRAADDKLRAELADLGFARKDQFEFIAGEMCNRRDAMLKLLKSNLKSDFRKSLRKQLTDWLNKTPAERTYPSPFSGRQWDCLVSAGPRYHSGWSRYR